MLKTMAIIFFGLFCYTLGTLKVKTQVIVKEVQIDRCEDIITIVKRTELKVEDALNKSNIALSAFAHNIPYMTRIPDSLIDTNMLIDHD